eukprot:TRINITY_DN166_c0_g2_i1.p1 TRINITY_DN166_c0_g2~~TRINITY_DN166_c0_g2_i1.p1  ORF type:complete len:218 (-),score=55.88 TRINITY_DN166_c0_g2_i1:72-725(-)
MHSHLSECWIATSQILEKVATNMSNNLSAVIDTGSAITCFDSISAPSITLRDYAARIRHYSNCSDSCCILAFIYIDRILQKNPTMILKRNNVHRLFLAAVVVAVKYGHDEYYDNRVYSRIGGISLAELNFLELALISLLKYELYVDPQLFFDYAKELEIKHKECEEKEENKERNSEKNKEENKKESKEEMVDVCQSSGKVIEGVASLRTVGSSNEMA